MCPQSRGVSQVAVCHISDFLFAANLVSPTAGTFGLWVFVAGVLGVRVAGMEC